MARKRGSGGGSKSGSGDSSWGGDDVRTMDLDGSDGSPVWRGPAKLVPLLVPLASYELDPANARDHPERNLDDIRASLADHGQVSTITIDANGICRKGNGTTLAAKSMGWTHLAAVPTDLASVDAVRYAIRDNRTGETSAWNAEVLGDLFAAIEADGGATDDLGWTEAERGEMLGSPSGGAGDGDGGGESDPEKGQGLESLESVIRSEPKADVRPGDVWRLGGHVLVVADVFEGWPEYVPHLEPGALLVPYPGPLVALSRRAASHNLVLVQPDVYVAALVVDYFEAGAGEAELASRRGETDQDSGPEEDGGSDD